MLAENEEPETESAPELAEETKTDEPTKMISNSPETENDEATAPPVVSTPEEPKPKQKLTRHKSSPKYKQVVNWFSVCARCSFFLAAYKTIIGEEALDEAAVAARTGWLELVWNQGVCKLVHKSYGSRLDMDCVHYDGICPDCRRHFSFRGGAEKEEANIFQIELKPRAGR